MSRKRNAPVFAAMATIAALSAGCSPSAPVANGEPAPGPLATEQTANAPDPGKRPARRARASLSLPYFSFAQSLNPRS